MKKFVFTLQRLYEVKEREEEEKRLELGELDKEMEGYLTRLNQLMDSFEEQKKKYNEKCTQGINKIDLKNYGDFFDYLNREMLDQHQKIEECQKKIDVCRQELLKLINEQKVLDKMREEQLIEYNAELQKGFDKEIEDFMQGRM